MENLENMLDKYTETKIVCINQFFRPQVAIKLEGYGDCTICKTDEKNKYCKGYYPIKVCYCDVCKERYE